MKPKLFTILIVMLCIIGCKNDGLQSEVESLKNELTTQSQLIDQIQKGLTIKNIEKSEAGYIITFSDGKSILLNNTPVITIGANGNWFIDGTDTGQASQGTNGSSPVITIGANGNWFINGKDTGQLSKGTNGTNAASITSVVENGNLLTFYFSDGTSINATVQQKLTIVGWGDSLTAGFGGVETSYPYVLQGLMGSKYQIVNAGIGGETSLMIAARQGGIPMLINSDVTIPADNSPVTIGNKDNTGLISSWDNSMVVPLLLQNKAAYVNNCEIDGVECIIKWTGEFNTDPNGVYTIQRVAATSTPVTLRARSVVYTYAMKYYRGVYANVFFMGQNGGYSNSADLVAQYKAMIGFSNCKNYLVIGLSSGSSNSRTELEKLMTKEFGACYINLRDYLVTHGLTDANITPTPADITAMSKGMCPPSLLIDDVHFNAKGYTLIGNLVYKHFQYLGIAQ